MGRRKWEYSQRDGGIWKRSTTKNYTNFITQQNQNSKKNKFPFTKFIFHDKKTHKTYITDVKFGNDWLFWDGHKLWREMNDFILDSGVWEENPRPTYENTPDFRNIII